MDELFQKLENESLLLLYLAGELPERDRLELEALLVNDAGLRDQLESLRQALEVSHSALAELDAREYIGSTDRAVRQVGTAMRQWHLDRLSAPKPIPAGPRRLRYVAYSGTIAASILLGFCVWWGVRPELPVVVSSSQPSDQQTDVQVATDDSKTDETPTAAAPTYPAGNSAGYSAGAIARGEAPLVSLDMSSTQLADLERAVSDDLH